MHPATWFILAACLMPFFKKMRLMKVVLIAVPLITFFQIHWLPESFGHVSYLGFDLVFGKVDQLTRVFLHVLRSWRLSAVFTGCMLKRPASI